MKRLLSFSACLLVFVSGGLSFLPIFSAPVFAANDHESHSGHSDALMVLLSHKIALQKLQDKGSSASTLVDQAKHIQQVMPVLKSYMSTPKSYYLTTEMYHDSLENRAAMLADFSTILLEYQKQLVSAP